MAEAKKKPEDDLKPQISSDRELYTVPSRSAWFRWDEIHETERRCLPEFFNSSSISRSPRVYKEYRDFIINKYRENPSRRLTFSALRKSLIGDVGFLHRVYDFLDKWGLINLSMENATELPSSSGEYPPVVVEYEPSSGIRVVAQPNATKEISLPSHLTSNVGEKARGRDLRLSPLTSYSDVFDVKKAETYPQCGSCGERCASGRYESVKEGFTCCTKCYNGENVKGLESAEDLNFFDGEDSTGKLPNKWTDMETLHLLEAIIARKNDWALVSDQTRRSNLDCIAKLIQLPLGDHVLSTTNVKYDRRNKTKEENAEPTENGFINLAREASSLEGEAIEKPEEDDHLEPPSKRRCLSPWPYATDSLMKQVADISTVAGPDVAAAAAEAAITAICRESPYAKKVLKVGDDIDVELNTIARSLVPEATEDISTQEHHEPNERSGPVLEKDFGKLIFKMRVAIGTAFGSVASRAKMLADQEDREIEHLVASITEAQLKKLQCKIRHFDELESIMEKEYVQIQQSKESILTEWIGILQKTHTAVHKTAPKL